MASIYDREGRPKRWEVKYRTPDGKQRSRSFQRLADAKKFKAKVEVEMESGTYVDPRAGAITFGSFAAEAVPSIERRYRPTSAARLHSALTSRILPRWRNVKLTSIQHSMVQRWVDELSDDGLAPATVHKTYLMFRTVMKETVKARLLPDLPWGDLHLPTVEKHEARFLEPVEVDRLADAIGGEWRAFVYLGAGCGLRAGELFGLRWSCIDFERRTVEVREAATEANGRQYVGQPKTAASRRRVPIPRVVVDELELHRLTAIDPDGLVFPTEHGRMWRATNFRNRVWKPACERAGLGGLVIHELRHSAVAAWIEVRAEPVEVAARAGHRSVVTILDRYGHRFPAQAQRVNDGFDELYRAARAETTDREESNDR